MPVGEDQQQHLELSRELADLFNRTFKSSSPMFPLPQLLISMLYFFVRSLVNTQSQLPAPSRRILSLKDPTSKMSKSSPDVQSRILLTDDASQIKSKIRAAVTDSIPGITFDPVSRPGSSNLLTILAACTNDDAVNVAKRYEGKGHGQLKADVAEAVEELLKGSRAEFEKIRGEMSYLRDVARDGAERARICSEVTMREVRSRIGLP